MRAMSIHTHSALRRRVRLQARASWLLAVLFVFCGMQAAGQGFALSINGPRGICVGETGVYTAVSDLGTGYSWTVARGTIVSGQNTNSISVEWAGGATDTITLYAVSVAGVPETRSIIVQVYGLAKPIIEPNGPTTICLGGAVELWAPPGFNDYRWSNGSTQQFIRVTDAGTFTVTVFNSHGCSATSPPLKVNMLLPPQPRITPSGSTTFCEGESVVLDGGAGYHSYDWSNGEGTRFITVTKGGFYDVTVRDINGCRGTSPTLAVNVIPSPAPPTISRQGTRLISSPGSTYQWFRDGALIQGATDRFLEAPGSGRYLVRITNQTGCVAESAPHQFVYAGMTVRIPDLDVDLHQTLQLPMVISESSNLESVPQLMYRAVIRFNKNALYPLNAASTISGDDRIVTMSGTWSRGDSVLGVLQCTPMWSDITETTVRIDSFTFFNNDVYVNTRSGKLRWLLCNQGGTRLFINADPMGVKQNHPNPFNASTNIEYTVIEEGRTLLTVYDIMGRKAATLVDAEIPPGTYRVVFDASALPSGMYMYVLQTPTDRDVKMMELVK